MLDKVLMQILQVWAYQKTFHPFGHPLPPLVCPPEIQRGWRISKYKVCVCVEGTMLRTTSMVSFWININFFSNPALRSFCPGDGAIPSKQLQVLYLRGCRKAQLGVSEDHVDKHCNYLKVLLERIQKACLMSRKGIHDFSIPQPYQVQILDLLVGYNSPFGMGEKATKKW